MEVIRATTEDQLQDAYAIRKKVFVEEQHVPLEIEIDDHENDSSHFVLYDENKPVGAGRFRILNGKGKVERICILPSYRGKGAGLKVMKKIEEFASDLYIKELVLNAQTSAIPFYTKQGYEVVSEEFFDAGIPHRTMKKTLKHTSPLDS
ncbi:GNAT family N-acetyltransferase [Siminovitchia sp. FSL H7-0308]|uniref:GNAT family N-acyltransferase n=1 Tax=Siminovitchia thermophila TaxID=1245522 RepID=A0ABS2RCF1_9BACI|nr:GNAT family N-acetyltransferase [Siminovitchia thermophila]MBM7717336.1 putative GNAT family N-acyltransferase [Siminovitchia thermophila]ONK24379.1 GNAT family N-acetyltransferase [Bacillus sp. VT-16-64]